MATGFYAAASGMLMQQRSLNVLGNNMSNVRTPGFKTERVISNVFEHELMNRIEGGADHMIGKGAPVRIVQDVPVGFDEPSSLKETERPYDMAIDGIGFFNVLSADGEEYLTRNGNFDIDTEGYLILRGGGRVQGDRGDIRLGKADFTVDEDGTIYNAKGSKVDTLKITAAAEGTTLTKAGNGLYKADPNPPQTLAQAAAARAAANGEDTVNADIGGQNGETGVVPVENPKIRQKWLENSNINMNREMSLMMQVQRNFQSCSQALKMIDQIDQKTANICAQP